MIATTIKDFTKNLKSYYDRAVGDFQTIVISGEGGSGAVLISLEEYNSLNATAHETSSKPNKDRLDKAVEDFKSGNTFIKELIEE